MTEITHTNRDKLAQLQIKANGSTSVLIDPKLCPNDFIRPPDVVEFTLTLLINRKLKEDIDNKRVEVTSVAFATEAKDSCEASDTNQARAHSNVKKNPNGQICLPDGTGALICFP